MNMCFEIFDNTNSKQLIQNHYLKLLLNKLYINNNLHKNYLLFVFDIQSINNIHFGL